MKPRLDTGRADEPRHPVGFPAAQGTTIPGDGSPSAGRLARLPRDHPPVLIVVVDTEEEFDWLGEFSRANTRVTAMQSVGRGQEVCDEFGVRPLYAVDYPVASQREGIEPLQGILAEGRAELGAHLHPWVNPPFLEIPRPANSYPGNLPPELESAKLERLTDAILEGFGVRPEVYKAGRSGLGPNTLSILEEQGYQVDLSPRPPYDLRSGGGPDFSSHSIEPAWFGDQRRLLSVPATGAFLGFLASQGRHLQHLVRRPLLRALRAEAILSRLGAYSRVSLSPEGMSAAELRALTNSLLSCGVRAFNLCFHSTSLKPGCTPYVSGEGDLERLLDALRRYFDFFLGDLGGQAMTPLELKRRLEGLAPRLA